MLILKTNNKTFCKKNTKNTNSNNFTIYVYEIDLSPNTTISSNLSLTTRTAKY